MSQSESHSLSLSMAAPAVSHTVESIQEVQAKIEAGDPSVIPELISRLRRSSDTVVIRLLARVISDLCTAQQLRRVSKLYNHPDTHVRLYVLAAILRHKNYSYYPLLVHGYLRDSSKKVRTACRRKIQKLSPKQLQTLLKIMKASEISWMPEVAEELECRLSRSAPVPAALPKPEMQPRPSGKVKIAALDNIKDLGPEEPESESPDSSMLEPGSGVLDALDEEEAEARISQDPRARLGIAESIRRDGIEMADRTFSRQDCPKCGERIMVEALLCRYCLTIFDQDGLDQIQELAKVRVVPLPVRSPSHRGSALITDLFLAGLLTPVGGLGILYFLFRDSLFSGVSLGKRQYALQAVDSETGEKLSHLQSFLRNVILLIPFGAIPEVFLLSATGQRIGDRISNSRVIFKDDPPATALLAGTFMLFASIFSIFLVILIRWAPTGSGWKG